MEEGWFLALTHPYGRDGKGSRYTTMHGQTHGDLATALSAANVASLEAGPFQSRIREEFPHYMRVLVLYQDGSHHLADLLWTSLDPDLPLRPLTQADLDRINAFIKKDELPL